MPCRASPTGTVSENPLNAGFIIKKVKHNNFLMFEEPDLFIR